MATDNLKQFSVEWVIFGLLLVCLMTFATTFMLNNNPGGLGDSGSKFGNYSSDMQSKLVATEDTTNSLLNISSQSDPEIGNLGSKDSVATSYGIMGIAKDNFDSFKLFLSFMLTGTTGQMFITVFVGLFGLTVLYFITKWIRQGA